MRTFICIDFPTEIIKESTRIQSLISNKKFIGKLTEPENLHITLKFLGELDEKTIQEVKSLLNSIEFKEFTAHIEKTGTFNYKGQPKIVWLKIASKDLYDLKKEIDEKLKDLFKPEERFMSHLTIARIKQVSDPKNFKEHVSNIKPKKISFKIKEFKLKSSELKPLGPIYEILENYKSK